MGLFQALKRRSVIVDYLLIAVAGLLLINAVRLYFRKRTSAGDRTKSNRTLGFAQKRTLHTFGEKGVFPFSRFGNRL